MRLSERGEGTSCRSELVVKLGVAVLYGNMARGKHIR